MYLSAISETIPVGYRFLFIFLVTSIIYLFIYLFGVELIYNVVLVSGVQQSNSVIHMHIYILFPILFHYRLLQDIEYSSLYHTVGPCCLFILYIVVCIY